MMIKRVICANEFSLRRVKHHDNTGGARSEVLKQSDQEMDVSVVTNDLASVKMAV